jgi:hypothetical protein
MQMTKGDFNTADMVSYGSALSGVVVPSMAMCSVDHGHILMFDQYGENL